MSKNSENSSSNSVREIKESTSRVISDRLFMKRLNETIQKIQKILMERNDTDVCFSETHEQKF